MEAAIQSVTSSLKLTSRVVYLLKGEADAIITQTVDAFDRFEADGKQFNQGEWKLVKTRARLSVYKEQTHGRDGTIFVPIEPSIPELDPDIASGSSPWSDTASPTESIMTSRARAVMYASKPAYVPMLVESGLVEGKVEDYLLGTLSTGDFHHKRSDVYADRGIEETRELAVLQRPTEDDPLHHLQLKWCISVAAVLKTVPKPRDHVRLEGSGFRYTARGERVGYHLLHTVDHDLLAENPGFIRGKYSFCWILRQHDERTIEIYAPGYADAGGCLLEVIPVLVCAHYLLANPSFIECGQRKKLQWLVQKYCTDKKKQEGRHSRTIETTACNCSVCGKRLGKFNFFGSTSYCAICRELTCSKCSVTKKLALEIQHGEPVVTSHQFCIPCIHNANALPATDVAFDVLE